MHDEVRNGKVVVEVRLEQAAVGVDADGLVERGEALSPAHLLRPVDDAGETREQQVVHLVARPREPRREQVLHVVLERGGPFRWLIRRLSGALAPPALVLVSAAAFLLSELVDFAVYTPLRRRRLLLAMFASGLVGLVVDTIVFLYLAFAASAACRGR